MYSEEFKDHQRIAISNLSYSDYQQGKNQARDHEMVPRTRGLMKHVHIGCKLCMKHYFLIYKP